MTIYWGKPGLLSGCPVSLIMRYGQRAELRCLKYLRRLRASVVSAIMRQIDALSVLYHQVKEPVPHLGETPTRMPHIRAPCLGLNETGQRRVGAPITARRPAARVGRLVADLSFVVAPERGSQCG